MINKSLVLERHKSCLYEDKYKLKHPAYKISSSLCSFANNSLLTMGQLSSINHCSRVWDYVVDSKTFDMIEIYLDLNDFMSTYFMHTSGFIEISYRLEEALKWNKKRLHRLFDKSFFGIKTPFQKLFQLDEIHQYI